MTTALFEIIDQPIDVEEVRQKSLVEMLVPLHYSSAQCVK